MGGKVNKGEGNMIRQKKLENGNTALFFSSRLLSADGVFLSTFPSFKISPCVFNDVEPSVTSRNSAAYLALQDETKLDQGTENQPTSRVYA